MTPVVLADASALVALLNRKDRHHTWARERFKELSPPLLISEPVLAEASFLLGRLTTSLSALLAMWERDVLCVSFSTQAERSAILRLLKRYNDIPMSLADATLVRMSEIHHECRVWTLDSDFHVYRRNGRQVIPLIYPEGG